MSAILLNLDEVWLKGKNRNAFMNVLRSNILQAARQVDPDIEYLGQGPQQIVCFNKPLEKELLDRLLKVPGVASVQPGQTGRCQLDAIEEAVDIEMKTHTLNDVKTFRVVTSRSNKQFPQTSMEVSRNIGAKILKEGYPLKVQMTNPDLILKINILRDRIFVSSRSVRGVGGLPVGVSGHVVSLLSGGFDSPVASYLMSKRGCDLTFVFFYAYPYVGDPVRQKILQLSQILATYQRRAKLYVVPFGKIQKSISDNAKEAYRTLFFRQNMIRGSGLLAKRIKAQALVTGDALGQVSSQTLINMSLMDQVSNFPILRPLVGYNKFEIIDLSKKIGTHDVSVVPHDDACSLFAPKHPVLNPEQEYIDEFNTQYQFEDELNEALDRSQVIDLKEPYLPQIKYEGRF